MRIVDRKTFLTLPPGTVYAQGSPHAYGEWMVKDENCGDNDWFYDDLSALAVACTGSGDLFDKQESMLRCGCSYPADFEQGGRDGGFVDDATFTILEPDDIRALIARLQKCIGA